MTPTAERDFLVGVQVQPERAGLNAILAAWRQLDALGVDSLWLPDHFFPVSPGDPSGENFECWTLLAALASSTNATIGSLVSCTAYRSPDLLADMARTTSVISGGRLVLGLGAGWCERDHVEYGLPFGDQGGRLRRFEADLGRIRARLPQLNPPAAGLRVLIGGGGEKVTLRLVGEHADLWNAFGPPESFARKNAVLDQWCAKAGRDPRSIERTVFLEASEVSRVDEYLAAGAEHLIVGLAAPFDLDPVERLMNLRR